MKVILDRDGFSKMIDYQDERVGAPIQVALMKEVEVAYRAISDMPAEAKYEVWQFEFSRRLDAGIALYKFSGVKS